MHNQGRCWLTVVTLLSLLSSTAGCYRMRPSQGGGQAQIATTRSVRPADIALPGGYRIEALATGLTFPTSVIVDDHGIPHVVEAGYSYGEAWTTARLLRVEPDGQTRVIASGGRNGPWSGGSIAAFTPRVTCRDSHTPDRPLHALPSRRYRRRWRAGPR
jgi:hypothetical protein